MHYVYLLRSVSDGGVAASTQNQALSALLFLYKEVLKQELGWLKNVERAKKAGAFTRGAHTGGGAKGFSALAWHCAAHGRAAVWQRTAIDGMCPTPREWHRLRVRSYYCARRKRRQGTRHD